MELNVTYRLKSKMQTGEKIFTAMAGPGNDPKKTVKALKAFGYDAVIVDLEHTLLNDETVLSYILAGKETGLPIWLRLPHYFHGLLCIARRITVLTSTNGFSYLLHLTIRLTILENVIDPLQELSRGGYLGNLPSLLSLYFRVETP